MMFFFSDEQISEVPVSLFCSVSGRYQRICSDSTSKSGESGGASYSQSHTKYHLWASLSLSRRKQV